MILDTTGLSKEKAKLLFNEIKEDGISDIRFKNLSDSMKDLREYFLAYKNDLSLCTSDYQYDLEFGLKIYSYFQKYSNFNETIASNYDFWRNVCINVVPDIIEKRHGFSPDYYYAKTNRMYIPVLWWFIHLSYQGSAEQTKEVLKNLNTDYIMQLVDRASSNGVYLNTSRTIMKTLSTIPLDIVKKTVGDKNLFRRVMMQDVARRNNYNLQFESRVQEYVNELFEACGVEPKDYE